jgi:hypothetical protein
VLLEVLREELRGVARGVRGLLAVLLPVEPALVHRERRGGRDPAARAAVVAPGRVLAPGEGAGVQAQGDLVLAVVLREPGRVLREGVHALAGQRHVALADEGHGLPVEHGVGGEARVAVDAAQQGGGGEELEGRGGDARGVAVALSDHVAALGIDHGVGQAPVDHGVLRVGGEAPGEVLVGRPGRGRRGGGDDRVGLVAVVVLSLRPRPRRLALLGVREGEHARERIREVAHDVEADRHRGAQRDGDRAPELLGPHGSHDIECRDHSPHRV